MEKFEPLRTHEKMKMSATYNVQDKLRPPWRKWYLFRPCLTLRGPLREAGLRADKRVPLAELVRIRYKSEKLQKEKTNWSMMTSHELPVFEQHAEYRAAVCLCLKGF